MIRTNRYRRTSRLVVFSKALMLLVAVPLLTTGANAEELASPWVEGFNNKARLIAGNASGGPNGAGPQTYAGIEIAMPPGWKTYWRNPGEAGGVPPEFDFAGSENLEAPEILYPAPHRLVDPKAGTNIGYKEHVVLPFAVVAKDKTKPALVKIKASYGVCKDICVPAEAELSLMIPVNGGEAKAIDEAVGNVPVRIEHGATPRPGASPDLAAVPSLKAWRLQGSKLSFDVSDTAGKGSDAFLYALDGFYVPVPKKIAEGEGSSAFEVDLSEGAKPEEYKSKSISVTIVGSKGQSETIIQLP